MPAGIKEPTVVLENSLWFQISQIPVENGPAHGQFWATTENSCKTVLAMKCQNHAREWSVSFLVEMMNHNFLQQTQTKLVNYLGVSVIAGTGWAAVNTGAVLGKENPPKLQVYIIQEGLPKRVFPDSGIVSVTTQDCVRNNHKANFKGTI